MKTCKPGDQASFPKRKGHVFPQKYHGKWGAFIHQHVLCGSKYDTFIFLFRGQIFVNTVNFFFLTIKK